MVRPFSNATTAFRIPDICDNIRDYFGPLKSILMLPPCLPMMDAHEQAKLASLPEVVPIWRGADKGRNERGLSWSLNRDVAAGFPFLNRYAARIPVLVSATVQKRHIIAVKLGREEEEVLTLKARITCAEPLSPKDSAA